jgi:hypothetical protein
MIGGTYNFGDNVKGVILCENPTNSSYHIYELENREINSSILNEELTSTIKSIPELVISENTIDQEITVIKSYLSC